MFVVSDRRTMRGSPPNTPLRTLRIIGWTPLSSPRQYLYSCSEGPPVQSPPAPKPLLLIVIQSPNPPQLTLKLSMWGLWLMHPQQFRLMLERQTDLRASFPELSLSRKGLY